MGKISLIEGQKVIELHEEGYSQRQISSKTGYSKTAVTEIIKNFRENGSLEDRKKIGRPPNLTKDDNKYLKTLSLRNRKKASTELAKGINTATGKNVSSSWIQRHLLKWGLRGCVVIQKPLLWHGNKEKRVRYAKQHKDWAQEMFNQVLYTDESKFEIFGAKRCQYVRRRIGEAYRPSV